MRRILTKIRTVLLVLKRGEFKEIAEEGRQRAYSSANSLILRRDLSKPLKQYCSRTYLLAMSPNRPMDNFAICNG